MTSFASVTVRAGGGRWEMGGESVGRGVGRAVCAPVGCAAFIRFRSMRSRGEGGALIPKPGAAYKKASCASGEPMM